MAALSGFSVVAIGAATHFERAWLYSLSTLDGIETSAALEETSSANEPRRVHFSASDQSSPDYLSLNPNNKIA